MSCKEDRKKHIILFLVFCTLSLFINIIDSKNAIASEKVDSLNIVKNIPPLSWHFYSTKSERYLPYTSASEHVSFLHLPADLLKDSVGYLVIESMVHSYLLIDNQVIDEVYKESPWGISMRTFREKFPEAKLISIWSPDYVFDYPPAIYVATKKPNQPLFSKLIKKGIKLNPHFFRYSQSTLWVGCFALMIIISLLQFSPYPLFDSTHVENMLNEFFMQSIKSANRFNGLYIILGLIYVSLSLFIIVSIYSLEENFLPTFLQDMNGSSTSVNVWLRMGESFIYVFLFEVARITWIYICSSLLYAQSLVYQTHIRLQLNFSYIGSVVLMLLSVLLLRFHEQIYLEISVYIQWLIVVFWGLRGIFNSIYVIQRLSLNKVYFFSYLCATEILPIVLSVKLFLIH